LRLYAGRSRDFVIATVPNQIVRKLSDAFFGYYGYPAAKSEIAAWGNSLRAMAQVVQYSDLFRSRHNINHVYPGHATASVIRAGARAE
jgi:hypothetical protein